MVSAHLAGPTGQDEDTSVLIGLRQSLKQVLLENKLLEQEISSVKELSVSVAGWLVQGSALEIRPVYRQPNPDSEDADVAPEMPAQLEAQPRSKRPRQE
ncbi:g13199 [Coccomyxa viridis]|uniref:G13199 protein n=1 Tax=Coccomyxa viridis TaxID=1274662 RepID=A0ABP1GGJ0_9CHLO